MVPSSQFVLARTAHKNGQSHYFLNERKINWTEATELLMAKGIDLEHNRFLILQVRASLWEEMDIPFWG